MNIEWSNFISRVAKTELPRLKYLNNGYNYRIPPPGSIIKDGKLHANHEYPDIRIEYSTINTSQTRIRNIYKNPVKINYPVELVVINKNGKESRTTYIYPDRSGN